MHDDSARARARELRDSGASFRVAAETLTAEGYPTPKGGPWLASTVFRLLQPPKPAGPGRGFRGQHTEESKRKMSESHKRSFANGRQPNRGNASKTHCPQGHPYDEENTYEIPSGGRGCKECMRQRTRERRGSARERRLQADPLVPRALEKPPGPLDYRMDSEGRKAYGMMHLRVRRARGPAKLQKCVQCAERGADKQAHDWARLRDRDGKDISDYIPLCRRCHIFYDQPRIPAPADDSAPHRGDGPGDAAIGQRRADQQRAKTHCPAGHEYTGENTYIIKRSGGRTARQCKTCTRAKAAASAAAKRKGA